MEPILFFESHWLKEHHLVVVTYTWFVMVALVLFSFLQPDDRIGQRRI